MRKAIKYISVLFVFMLFLNNICLATDIDMNLESNEVYENENLNVTEDAVQNSNTYTTVSSSSSTENNGLTLTNIINIFLVVVGVVLILLGLAILVRLKY